MNDVADSFFFQIMRMRKAIIRRTTALMVQEGIHLQMEQLPLLVILHKRGTLSQRELSDITLRDKSSILRSISALHNKGLVAVAQDKIDKRRNNIELSAGGKSLAIQINDLMRKAEEDALSVFPVLERAIALQTVKNYADKLDSI